MSRRVGVWIDHERARIVEAGHDAIAVVTSDASGHTRFTHGGGHPAGNSSQGGASERRVEERNRNALDRYFSEVITAVGRADALFIFGPGEAKQQLASRLAHDTARPQPTIAIKTTDKLTDAQVVDTVARHFAT